MCSVRKFTCHAQVHGQKLIRKLFHAPQAGQIAFDRIQFCMWLRKQIFVSCKVRHACHIVDGELSAAQKLIQKSSLTRSATILAIASFALSRSRHAIITRAPWNASARAVSYPMPVLLPVTMTTLALRSRPWSTASAVADESNFCLITSSLSSFSSTANASRGSVYVVFLLMWLPAAEVKHNHN